MTWPQRQKSNDQTEANIGRIISRAVCGFCVEVYILCRIGQVVRGPEKKMRALKATAEADDNIKSEYGRDILRGLLE